LWWGGRDILDLTAPFDGFGRVVCGFDRQMRGLVEGEFAVSLDAGAGRGGPLIAAAFAPDGAVLERLRVLDPVSYVRFASVYRQFDDVGEFQRELELLDAERTSVR